MLRRGMPHTDPLISDTHSILTDDDGLCAYYPDKSSNILSLQPRKQVLFGSGLVSIRDHVVQWRNARLKNLPKSRSVDKVYHAAQFDGLSSANNDWKATHSSFIGSCQCLRKVSLNSIGRKSVDEGKKSSNIEQSTPYNRFVTDLLPSNEDIIVPTVSNPVKFSPPNWGRENECFRNSSITDPEIASLIDMKSELPEASTRRPSVPHRPQRLNKQVSSVSEPDSRRIRRPSGDELSASSDLMSEPVRLFSDKLSEEIRIEPFLVNGVKVSDTHYLLLNRGPEGRRRRVFDSDGSSSTTSTATLSRNQLRLHLLHSANNYVNRKPQLNETIEQFFKHAQDQLLTSDRIDSEEQRTPSRGISRANSALNEDMCQTHFLNNQKGIVLQLNCSVPLATEDECKTVLIGSNWDFEEAEKRLKVEILSKRSVDSLSYFRRVLRDQNWDLERSIEFVENDREKRQSLIGGESLERHYKRRSSKSRTSRYHRRWVNQDAQNQHDKDFPID
ncbi:hypothetical protein Ciccas_003190 [Cichlidogyrus casuarinus]|uniref:Uncharacterized protein n=1 Tax=Cichlidogyrus casuarinus TaxID=1844966 RepID=A0ABD2QG19_9PLAT